MNEYHETPPDPLTMFHPLFKLIGLLFLPAPLQNRVEGVSP
jgi:hypothetical protein